MKAIYLLYLYIGFAIIGGLFYFFNIYHVAKFGLDCRGTRITLAVYTAVFGLTIVLGVSMMMLVDWSSIISLPLPSFFTYA